MKGRLIKPLLSVIFGLAALGPGAGQQPEAPSLELGRPVERELQAGQRHLYQLALSPGQYLRVSVAQRGVDVAVALFGPDDKRLGEVNRANGTRGSETVTFVAQAPVSGEATTNA
jgi:hypothetical protein